jgi:glycerophosphoryl diester phosphodiesterase
MVRGRGILQLDVKRGVSLAKVARAVEEASAGSFTGIITYNARGAYAVGRASGAVSVFATAQDEDELRALSGDGILDGRLVVWTGIHRGLPDERYIRRPDEADIAASGGALGYLDDRAASGDRSAYSRLEGAGIDIIATDRPIEAARELGTEEARAAILSCGAQPPGEAPA